VTDRGSDKHGSRIDEEMKHETRGLEQGAPVEPRAEESRQQEPAAEGEMAPDARPDVETLAEARAELARHLEPSVFPAAKESLLESASSQGAPNAVIGTLQRLPDGKTFRTFEEVWEALGGPNF
jgi:Protein of unknown function (DUF2795)